MELQDYLAVARKRWVSIIVITTIALGAAVALTLVTTPRFEARSQVFVSVRTGSTTSDLLQGSSFTQKQVKSYTDLVTSPRVLIPVIEHLNLATTPDELAKSVTASSPLDTVLINIVASDVDAQVAADLANTIAQSLATEVTALEKPEGDVSPVQISTVRAATAPTAPATPNTKLNLALGLLLGLALAIGVAVLREVLDTRIRTEADVRQVTDASVIATITHDEDAEAHPLIVHSHPHSHRAEALRRLRTNLQFLDVAENLQTFVVTSSLPGEGKSTTTINLAITLADAGARVILVDADLRRPSVARYMDLEGSVGLTTVLIGRARLEDVIQPWGNGQLHVLASGQIPPNPSELLGSRAMATLLERLGQQYDVVLIDTPPLLPVTDAAILARVTSGALVVVSSSTLHRQQLTDSLGALETVGARVLGVVLNRVPPKEAGSYSYYDYSPIDGTGPGSKGGRRTSRRAAARAERRPGGAPRRLVPAESDHRPEPVVEDAAAAGSSRWPGSPIGAGKL
ncbi:MAG TPA: polysaccharide biosynthesis tyrosine autokinase [Actinotalea sp.]